MGTLKKSGTKYDVVGIGNAIVDVLTFCPDETLSLLKLAKGAMQLIDEKTVTRLYMRMGQATQCSGGSVANTLAGLAGLGASCAFIGKVRDDEPGSIFSHDMRSLGITFETPAATVGPATARCLIYVTPDAQRTMNTFLGACTGVTEADINENLIGHAQVLYIEGYLWDAEHAKSAIRKGIKAAKTEGRKVAFTLSDIFCVERHRAEFMELLNDIDILFANERELMGLFETLDFDKAIKALRGKCPIAVVTRSEKGCIILSGPDMVKVPVEGSPRVIDTTGAGDLFASGFLFGHTRGWEVEACARLGNACAGQIIQQIGARSLQPLKPLLKAHAA